MASSQRKLRDLGYQTNHDKSTTSPCTLDDKSMALLLKTLQTPNLSGHLRSLWAGGSRNFTSCHLKLPTRGLQNTCKDHHKDSLYRLGISSKKASSGYIKLDGFSMNQNSLTRTFCSAHSVNAVLRSPVSKCRALLQTQSKLGTYPVQPHVRFISRNSEGKAGFTITMNERNKSVMMYVMAVFILAVGVTYAAVPLYAVFCQATGYGGAVKQGHDTTQIETMQPVKRRPLLIQFNADTAASMRWNFKPQQREVVVYPGETALAFYSAINPTDTAIIGVSTYNVVPFEAGKYFNKIQCFCFEEQRLNPYEQVDMPVFFFIDPEFADDPKMDKIEQIILSYTFFEAKEGLVLPDPMERR